MWRFRVRPGCLGLLFWAVQARAAGTEAYPLAWLGALPSILLALAALAVALAGVALVWRAFLPGADGGFSLRWQVGGFGSPGRGWRLSTPLTQLLAGLVLVGLAVALALARMPVEEAAPAGKGRAPNAETERSAVPTASTASAASH